MSNGGVGRLMRRLEPLAAARGIKSCQGAWSRNRSLQQGDILVSYRTVSKDG